MKKSILLVLITAIICIVGTASAAYVYTARDIGYTPQDENWNVTNANDALTSLKDDLNTITNKVEGIERVYKAGEVELVALVSDDSFYKDNNGKYVLANSDTGRTLLADTSTYKSLSSTDDCVGIVGQDVVSSYSKESSLGLFWLSDKKIYKKYTLIERNTASNYTISDNIYLEASMGTVSIKLFSLDCSNCKKIYWKCSHDTNYNEGSNITFTVIDSDTDEELYTFSNKADSTPSSFEANIDGHNNISLYASSTASYQNITFYTKSRIYDIYTE